MSVEVFLARHGESQWHAENRYAGVTDVALTERGRSQAEGLSAWAAGADLSAVWCSTLSRARETASQSAEAAGVDLQSDDRLRELDFGIAEGLTRAELTVRHPVELSAFEQDPAGSPFPEGEAPAAATDRYVSFLDDLLAAPSGGSILVVAHSTVIRLTLCRLLGIELGRYRRVFPQLVNCALTHITYTADDTALRSFNVAVSDAAERIEAPR